MNKTLDDKNKKDADAAKKEFEKMQNDIIYDLNLLHGIQFFIPSRQLDFFILSARSRWTTPFWTKDKWPIPIYS